MSNETISVRAWIDKHSLDQGDSFSFLVGKTLDGVMVRSLTTKISEAALDSYLTDVCAVQKRKPVNKGLNKLTLLGQRIQDIVLRTQNAALKKKIAAKPVTTNSECKLIPTTDDIPKQIENNLSSQSTIMKPTSTANLSKVIGPDVLTRIQRTQQEKVAVRKQPPSQSIKHCIKCNEELEIDARFCSECREKQPTESNIIPKILETSRENSFLKQKFIEAARQSKICPDGYILMNELALTLKELGIEWEGSFKKFLENHKDIIEFKAAPYNAPAIRIISQIPMIPEKTYFLEQKLKEADKIYIDTCSLMETPIEEFFEKANSILKEYNKKIIVILAVELELKKLATSKDKEKQAKAKKVLDGDVLYPEINEIKIIGSEINDKGIADSVFKSIFEAYRPDFRMLLISQDFDLSKEILEMNNSKSVSGKKCEVCKIDEDGYLKPFVVP